MKQIAGKKPTPSQAPFAPSGEPERPGATKADVPKAQVDEFYKTTGTAYSLAKAEPTDAKQSKKASITAPNPPLDH